MPDRKFKVMVIKILTGLEKGERSQWNLKDLERLRKNFKNQPEIRNSITEIKNKLDGINNSEGEVEKRISDLEDRVMESNQAEQERGKKINENRLRELIYTVKHNNIHIIEIPEGEERQRWQKLYLKK